jgi:hypothetical protein
MFETLEPPEQIVARPWPYVLYVSYGVFGLTFFVLGALRHGFSHPFRLAVSAAMLYLSLTWLISALRAGPPITTRKLAVRNMIFVLLLIAQEIIPR